MTYRKGVDVSAYQKTIDWAKAKADGVEFAMLRAGWGKNHIDGYFAQNARECNRLGIPVGVYWFCYALNAAEAEQEARYCLDAIRSFKIDLPVCYDLEYDTVRYAKTQGVTITKALASSMTRAFCKAVQDAGHRPMVYANQDYLRNYFEDSLVKENPLWLAMWPASPDLEVRPKGAPMWQYSDAGSVSGIPGKVDMDVCYEESWFAPKEPKLWYEDACRWAVDSGLIQGGQPREDGSPDFMWDEPLSRRQFVTVLHRYWQMMLGG